MDPIYSHGPRWEGRLFRAAIVVTLVFCAGMGGAALWAMQQDQQPIAVSDTPLPKQKQQLRLNLPRSIAASTIADAAEDEVAPAEQAEYPAARTEAPEPTANEPAETAAPAPAPASEPGSESDTVAETQAEQSAEAETEPSEPTAPPAPPAPPPAAPHLLQLVVTDKQASVDELVLLPKGMTLVISATNERLTDYVTFARHLGHSVLVAFPVTEDNTHPALMTPSLSDQENLDRLSALLDEHSLIDGVKLYWHNPLAGRDPLMVAALKIITERGLVLVGSNGPLMAREVEWAAKAGADLIQIATVGETASTLPQPDYGDRDTAQRIQFATALSPNGQDELTDWVNKAKRAGWTFVPLKKQTTPNQ